MFDSKSLAVKPVSQEDIDRQLVTLRDLLYEGSWKKMGFDLLTRLKRSDLAGTTKKVIREDLARIGYLAEGA